MADSEGTQDTAKRSLEQEANGQGEKKQKVSLSFAPSKVGLAKPGGLKKPIAINLGGASGSAQAQKAQGASKPAGPTATSVFNADESESEEEIPPEARMRMRNIGKDTPTSAGPLSFNKTSRGFTDQTKLWQAKANELAQKEGVELASAPSDSKDAKDPHKQVEALADKAQQKDA